MLIAVPPAILANFSANSLAAGMNVGTAVPRLTRNLRNGQYTCRSHRMSMWPSSACMQSRITRFARPLDGLQQTHGAKGMAQQRDDEVLQPKRNSPGPGPASGQNGRQQAHRVGAFGIAHRLDVRVLVDVNARADRDALRQVVWRARHAHSDQRLGIGAHILAQLIADRRQRAFVLQVEEQFHRPQRRRRENHAATGEAPRMLPKARGGLHGANFVSRAAIRCAAERTNVDYSVSAKTCAPRFSAR